MKMSNDKKKEVLLKNFEIIKDNYAENDVSLGKAVVKMFKIDPSTAVDMWIYLLTKHEKEVKGEDSWQITGRITYEGGEAIGENKMCDIVISNPILKKVLFSYTCHDIELVIGDYIKRKIETNELQFADELLQLVYANKYKNSSWYDIMDYVIPDSDDSDITTEAYELLESWCDKVKKKEDRAKLSIKMMDFMD